LVAALGDIWRTWGEQSCACVVWLVGKNDDSATKNNKYWCHLRAKKIWIKMDRNTTTVQIFLAGDFHGFQHGAGPNRDH
jgi:sarcosine oxidase delta subunit